MICKICGDKKAKKVPSKDFVKALYTKNEPYFYTIEKCSNCREELCGDDHDRNVRKARKIAFKRELLELIAYFKKKKKLAEIERILELKRGHFEKLAESKTAAINTELSLLRIARSFPTLIDMMYYHHRMRQSLNESFGKTIDRINAIGSKK
jgi:hypothetical protein